MPDSPLGRLIGAWELEPLVEGRSMGRGRATFEWIADGAFVLQRSDAEWSDPGWAEHAPKTTQAVLGFDDATGEITQLYADDRGVHRIYRGSLTDEAWQMNRAAPGFHQRFIGTVSGDGQTIEGRWESSPDGTDWALDFPITYRKVR
jgi:hypothetical protein